MLAGLAELSEAVILEFVGGTEDAGVDKSALRAQQSSNPATPLGWTGSPGAGGGSGDGMSPGARQTTPRRRILTPVSASEAAEVAVGAVAKASQAREARQEELAALSSRQSLEGSSRSGRPSLGKDSQPGSARTSAGPVAQLQSLFRRQPDTPGSGSYRGDGGGGGWGADGWGGSAGRSSVERTPFAAANATAAASGAGAGASPGRLELVVVQPSPEAGGSNSDWALAAAAAAAAAAARHLPRRRCRPVLPLASPSQRSSISRRRRRSGGGAPLRRPQTFPQSSASRLC